MRSHLPLVTLALAATAIAQGPNYNTWLQSQYPNLQKVQTPRVLAEARQAGIASTPAEVAALKKAFYQLRGKDRRALPNYRRLDFGAGRLPVPAAGIDVAVEHENNDAWQWADSMIGQTTASGDNAAANDTDSWMVASTGEYLTVQVNAGGGAVPITDSILTLRNQTGDVIAFNDDNNGLLSAISIYLPAGIYYAEVGSYLGTGGGSYDLVLQSDPAQLVALTGAGAAGTTQAAGGAIAHDVFTFTVPEGNVDVTVGSSGDTYVVIQRSDGVVLFTNDDSGIGGLNGAADIDLPAGSYSAYVGEVTGSAGLAFTVAFASTPGAFTNIAAAGSANGTIGGDESLRLYRAVLPLGGRIDLVTNGGTTPIGDTILSLYDRNLDFLCDVDDDNFAVHGFYSRLAIDLPASNELVAVAPYPGAVGDFVLTATVGAGTPTGAAAFGSNALTYAGFGAINTYTLDNRTQVTTRFVSDTFWFAVIDQNGDLASVSVGSDFWPQNGELLAGRSYVLTWDRYNFTGAINLSVLPALSVEGGMVTTHGKAGDWVFLFGSFAPFTPGVNFGAGDRGTFCLQAGTIITVGLQIPGASGVNTWFAPPVVPAGAHLQSGDLHTGVNWIPPALATWRNILGV